MTPTPDRGHERWANLRHSIVGMLLAAPPPRGELQAALTALAAKTWQHPITGAPVRFAYSTLERWLYVARRAGHADTVHALRRRVRKDAGTRRAVSAALVAALAVQHREHPSWSYQLHADNLVALAASSSRRELYRAEEGCHAGALSAIVKQLTPLWRRRLGPTPDR